MEIILSGLCRPVPPATCAISHLAEDSKCRNLTEASKGEPAVATRGTPQGRLSESRRSGRKTRQFLTWSLGVAATQTRGGLKVSATRAQLLRGSGNTCPGATTMQLAELYKKEVIVAMFCWPRLAGDHARAPPKLAE